MGGRNSEGEGDSITPEILPFPSSLCHRCAAPPRYVRTDKGSVFMQCPILKGYPPQPVRSCDSFLPRGERGPLGLSPAGLRRTKR